MLSAFGITNRFLTVATINSVRGVTPSARMADDDDDQS